MPINANFTLDWSSKLIEVNTNIVAAIKSIMLKTYNGCKGHYKPFNLLNLVGGYCATFTKTLDGVFGGLE